MLPPADPSRDRFHGLDCLRAVAMFLGVALHAGLAYTATRVPFWPVHDPDPSPLIDLGTLAVHEFRMQVFFVLAGFFGCLLYQRHGLGGMLRHRAVRIGVPFGLALLLVQPTLQCLWLLGDHDTFRAMGEEQPPADVAKPDLVREHFLSGTFLAYLRPFHLWFLYFLLVFFAAVTPLLLLGRGVAGMSAVRAADERFGKLVRSPWSVLVWAGLTVPLLWPMRELWFADTPGGWRPGGHIFAYYFGFFLFGWQLYRHRDALPGFTHRWKLMLTFGNLVVFPGLIAATMSLKESGVKWPDVPAAERAAFLAGGALYTWLMIAGLTGFFLRVFSASRGWVRYLADASYWCYVMSLTPIIALQLVLDPLPWPGLVKFAVVTVGSTAVLLLTYQWFVRYTPIGTLLHGRRVRESHR